MGCTWTFTTDARPAGGLQGALESDLARVAGLLPGHPFDAHAWQGRAAWVQTAWPAVHGGDGGARRHRAALAKALGAYAARLDAPEASRANAARLADPDTLVVVAGQQAGLFTGPAYTVYKAATAIRLACSRAEELGRPVVPVFWMASEDHDYREAATVWALGADGRAEPLSLPPGPVLRSVGALPVPPAARDLVDRLLTRIREAGAHGGRQPEPAGGWVEGAVAGTLSESATLGEWFARQMLRLLGGQGLVLLDPMDPAVRELAAEPLARVAERLAEVGRALATGEADVREAGFNVQLRMAAGDTHLFRYHGGRRLALVASDGYVATRQREWTAPVAQLGRIIRSEPTAFSPGAALRPLVQDWLLPTLAQVVGPGELAYLPEVRPAYGVLDLEPPLWVPRMTSTLIWPEWAAALRKWGVTADALADERRRRAELERRLSGQDGVAVGDLFDDARRRVGGVYEDLASRLQAVSPHLKRLGADNRRHVEWQLDYFERKALAHQRRAHRDIRDAWERLAGAIAPDGDGQDRRYSVFALFGRFPEDCLHAFLAAAPLAPARSWAHVHD